jgi:uncharacterized damage-inducible protein DinB
MSASQASLPRLALRRGARSFQALAAAYLVEYLDKIRLAVGHLDDDGLWWRPAPGTNSAGNLLVHLAGNLSLWLLQGVGGRPYRRDRAGEFAADRIAGRDELLDRLARVVAECGEVVAGLAPEDLARPVALQGYDVDVLAALFHAVEHMSYHTGQIVWIAKQHAAAAGGGFEFYPQHAGE